MATGGANLCYIIPSLLRASRRLLLASRGAHARSRSLNARGVSACYLGSAQEDATIWDRLSTFQLILHTRNGID